MSVSTDVELVWIEKRSENRIRFGQVAHQRILDRSRRVVSFASGAIFAFVRWAAGPQHVYCDLEAFGLGL